MKDKVINIENLTVHYGRFAAIKNISFTVDKGDYVSIIGPNGAGKSTLVKTLLGLSDDYTGNISINRQKVGYLPQKTQTNEKTFPATVKEIVSLGLLGSKKHPKFITHSDQQKIEETLEKLNICDLKNRKIGLLSGGQQQRVLLARAIVDSPSILILDEPTSALDPKFRQAFYQLLHEINQKDQVTVLHITHDVSDIKNYSNKILYINETIKYYGDSQNYQKEHSHE